MTNKRVGEKKLVFSRCSQLNLHRKAEWASQGSSFLDADGFLVLTRNS